MDDVALFGEVRDSGLTLNKSLRYYKGQPIPWWAHDCDGGDCGYCRRAKHEFIKKTPAHTGAERREG